MNNNAFVVDNFGYLQMEYEAEFHKKMKDEGYEDPFWRRQQAARNLLNNLNINNSTDPRQWLVKKPLPTTTEEKQPQVLTPGKKYISCEEYTRQENEYIARSLYAKFGMDDRVRNYLIHIGREDLITELKPCMAGDRQCSLFCPDFPCDMDLGGGKE